MHFSLVYNTVQRWNKWKLKKLPPSNCSKCSSMNVEVKYSTVIHKYSENIWCCGWVVTTSHGIIGWVFLWTKHWLKGSKQSIGINGMQCKLMSSGVWQGSVLGLVLLNWEWEVYKSIFQLTPNYSGWWKPRWTVKRYSRISLNWTSV